MSNSIIRAKNIRKTYREADSELVVIDNLTMEFPHSGTVAITGRSGTGKSTLLHLLGGLDRPSSGEIYINDNLISTMGAEDLADFRAKNIGFIFQFHHLLPEFSALENVMLPLTISGVDNHEAEERAYALLERVGLKHRLQHRPGQLSGGEQQRVSIARALVRKPRIVLADEPTGNLDIKTAQEIQSLLLEMNSDLKNLMITVTHLSELARSMHCVLEMVSGGQLSDITTK